MLGFAQLEGKRRGWEYLVVLVASEETASTCSRAEAAAVALQSSESQRVRDRNARGFNRERKMRRTAGPARGERTRSRAFLGRYFHTFILYR